MGYRDQVGAIGDATEQRTESPLRSALQSRHWLSRTASQWVCSPCMKFSDITIKRKLDRISGASTYHIPPSRKTPCSLDGLQSSRVTSASSEGLRMLHALAVRGLPLTVPGGAVVDAVLILDLGSQVQAAVAPLVQTQTLWRHANVVMHAITSSRSFLRIVSPQPRGVADDQSKATDTVWAELGVH